jgi:hypothetical protein
MGMPGGRVFGPGGGLLEAGDATGQVEQVVVVEGAPVHRVSAVLVGTAAVSMVGIQ